MKRGGGKVPLSRATELDVNVGVDWSMDHDAQAWASYEEQRRANGGYCQVAYLRWVPSCVDQVLRERLPTVKITWDVTPENQRWRQIRVVKYCYPIVLIQSLFKFLRPQGKCHIAEVVVPLDPDHIGEYHFESSPVAGKSS